MKKNGPAPMPAAIAKLKGNYKKSRYGSEVEPNLTDNNLSSIPQVPPRLDNEGGRFWTAILSDAVKIDGYMANWDLFIFEELCYNYQTMIAAKKDIEINGNTSISPAGVRVHSIGYKIYKESSKDFIQLCREFGLSPSSRSGIVLMTKGKEDNEPDFEI